jgi:hypothetical protein
MFVRLGAYLALSIRSYGNHAVEGPDLAANVALISLSLPVLSLSKVTRLSTWSWRP